MQTSSPEPLRSYDTKRRNITNLADWRRRYTRLMERGVEPGNPHLKPVIIKLDDFR